MEWTADNQPFGIAQITRVTKASTIGVQVSTSGAPQQNHAPGVASHLIHFD